VKSALQFEDIFTLNCLKMAYLAKSTQLAFQSGTIEVGLSWERVPGSPNVDLDASAVCFSSTGALVDAAYYNQLTAMSEAIMHSGDCKRGDKPGFDEVIKIHLDEVKGVNVIVFLINAFSGGTLANCESAFCEIKIGENVLSTMSVSCSQSGAVSGLLLCALFRHPDTMNWQFSEIRQSCNGRHFSACLLPMREIVDQLIDPGAREERAFSNDKTFQMKKGDQLSIPLNKTKFIVGLGWTSREEDMDLDASATLLGTPNNDGVLHPIDICYYNAKKRPGVYSKGDSRSGFWKGDDEQIVIDLQKVEPRVAAIAISVTIYSFGRTFKDVTKSYVRIVDAKCCNI